MQQNNVKAHSKARAMLALVLVAVVATINVEPAFAQAGGVDKVNTAVENVLTILHTISLGVVTVAIIWAGYEFLFKRAEMGKIITIVAGGLLVGAAAELAAYFIG